MSGINKVPCRVCKEEIIEGSKKCIHCDSFQDWRRYLNFSNTVLALLVAFVSTLSIGIPVIKDALKEDKSEIVIGLQKTGFRELTVLASNVGTKSGGLTEAKLECELFIDEDIIEKFQRRAMDIQYAWGEKMAVTFNYAGKKPSFSYYLKPVDKEGNEIFPPPFLRDGEVKQYNYKIGVSEGNLMIDSSIMQAIVELSIEREFDKTAILSGDKTKEIDLFSNYHKRLNDRSKCQLRFTVINYNGESNDYYIHESCAKLLCMIGFTKTYEFCELKHPTAN